VWRGSVGFLFAIVTLGIAGRRKDVQFAGKQPIAEGVQLGEVRQGVVVARRGQVAPERREERPCQEATAKRCNSDSVAADNPFAYCCFSPKRIRLATHRCRACRQISSARSAGARKQNASRLLDHEPRNDEGEDARSGADKASRVWASHITPPAWRGYLQAAPVMCGRCK
jgi:hypothetical protein